MKTSPAQPATSRTSTYSRSPASMSTTSCAAVRSSSPKKPLRASKPALTASKLRRLNNGRGETPPLRRDPPPADHREIHARRRAEQDHLRSRADRRQEGDQGGRRGPVQGERDQGQHPDPEGQDETLPGIPRPSLRREESCRHAR